MEQAARVAAAWHRRRNVFRRSVRPSEEAGTRGVMIIERIWRCFAAIAKPFVEARTATANNALGASANPAHRRVSVGGLRGGVNARRCHASP